MEKISMLQIPEFRNALMGWTEINGIQIAVYDKNKCLDIVSVDAEDTSIELLFHSIVANYRAVWDDSYMPIFLEQIR